MDYVIDKSEVTLSKIAELLERGGFECRIDEEEKQVVFDGSIKNLRVQLHESYNSIRLKGHYWLNSKLVDSEIYELTANLSEQYYLPKFTHYRWSDGDLVLITGHIVHYTFGLHAANFLFTIRRFLDAQQGVYVNSIRGTHYDYVEPEDADSEDEGNTRLSKTSDESSSGSNQTIQ